MSISARLLVVGIAGLLLPANAAAQRRPIEVGFDAIFARYSAENVGTVNNDVTTLDIPAQGFRVGFFLSDLVSLETELSHRYASSDGESASSFSLGAGILYHLTPPVSGTTFYLGFGGGLNLLDVPNDSDTQFAISGQSGFKLLAGERIAFRLSGFFQRAFESDARLPANGVGVAAGISFFAR